MAICRRSSRFASRNIDTVTPPPSTKIREQPRACSRHGTGAAAPAQDIAQTRQQFAGIHRFGEEVVRAHLETEDAIHLIVFARHDDEGDVADGAQGTAQP